MKILFVGPNASEYAQMTGHGDVAAARWAYSLLHALADEGHEIMVLSHIHERIWPRGEKFWRSRDDRYLHPDWPCVEVSYPAVYKLREHWLNWAYPRKAKRLLQDRFFDAVLLYNCYEPYQRRILQLARQRGVPAFPIILDGGDPRKDNWQSLLRDTETAAGVVFLSHWCAANYPLEKPHLHLDGGVDHWQGSEESCWHNRRVKIFVHTGALDHWRGLEYMQAVAGLIDVARTPIRIVLCGRILPEMRDAFNGFSCVKMIGFVPDEELVRLCKKADGFLNVRNPEIGENILNFPSKIPHYLSYGKPIVSTWIDSFSPDYRDLLCVGSENTPIGFVEKLGEIAAEDQISALKRYHAIHDWLDRTHTWRIQSGRLANWMQQVIAKRQGRAQCEF